MPRPLWGPASKTINCSVPSCGSRARLPPSPEAITAYRKAVELDPKFTVKQDGVLLVSDQVHGSDGFHETLMKHHAKRVRSPQRSEWMPDPAMLDWRERGHPGRAQDGGPHRGHQPRDLRGMPPRKRKTVVLIPTRPPGPRKWAPVWWLASWLPRYGPTRGPPSWLGCAETQARGYPAGGRGGIIHRGSVPPP